MNTDLFTDKATRHFRNTIAQAFHHASLQGTKVVTPLHLMYALLTETGSIGEEILRRAGVKHEFILQLLGENDIIPLSRNAILSPNAKRAVERAVLRAARDSHAYIGTEHLLFGLIEIETPEIEFVLGSSNVKRKDIDQQLDVALKSASKLHEILSQMWGEKTVKQTWRGTSEKQQNKKTPALEYFGVELTDPKHAERVDPVVGRDSEIERVIHVLARRTKNNPLLLGDPGVGKTAIVEGLAKRIVAGTVPPSLLGRRIFAIDLGLMVAGTMYRGEFESRIKQLIDEVRENQDVILFIDEIHSIVGAGSSTGTLDAANLLKPALARGELHVIGATTFEEFKKHIEHDAALERRFQPVQVREPSPEETTEMLTHIKGHYEQFHGIAVQPDAIEASVTLAHKYFPEKHFPDKAIDLLDEAMSAIKIETADAAVAVRENTLRQEFAACDALKQKAVLKENYEEAQRIKLREKELEQELGRLREEQRTSEPRASVSAPDVQRVVERILRRPISTTTPTAAPESLHSFLSARLFGQDTAITDITHAITRAHLGLGNASRPLASFLFVGPTGVGKTELAKLVAEGVYHDSRALIRLDMTEFSEGFSVSKIMGAPAGYVGYRESTTLVDRLRRQPLSVLLFDEIDKAHPDVINILLQMLEEGRLTDASGKEASVKQAIIILTYQIAPEEITGSGFGFAPEKTVRSADAVRSSLFSVMRPELLNRIDQVCIFSPLDAGARAAIAHHALTEFTHRLAQRSIELEWDKTDIPEAIAATTADPKEGARKVRHAIEQQIEHPLVAHVARHPDQTSYRISVKNDILSVEPAYASAPIARTNPVGEFKPQTKVRKLASNATRRTA